ncbi:hypothetical protein [Actinomadura atramentaria]|uniref:Rv0361 family membrane protein n=1 Tax=Actinomadura atramentaria TaxID=1990 RepID=UPI0003825D58|nr:hypothetical protein [Actinomadura atramentaria]
MFVVSAALILVGALGLVAGAGRLALSDSGRPEAHGEQAVIQKTVTAFAGAVDRSDNATVLSMLCAQEAEGVADDIDAPDDHGDPKAALTPITVQNIRITGTTAQASITRPRQQPATVFLLKENGTWKLCDPLRYEH